MLSLVDTCGRLPRWRPRMSELELEVVHQAGIEHQAANAMSRTATDGADMTPTENDIPIAVIDATSNHKDKITLQHLRCQATAYMVEDNDNLQKGTARVPTLENLL